MFKYFLYKLGLFFLHRFPSKTFCKITTFISDVQYSFSIKDRRAIENNHKIILSKDKVTSSQIREVFRNFGRYLTEFFQMDKMVDENFIKTKVNIKGVEHLDHVLSQKRGGIIVTAHIGNWELGAAVLSTLGYPIAAVALPHNERPVNDLFNKQREAKGITIIPTTTAVRRCIERLKDNELVSLVADRDFGEHGILMEFLGTKALIPKGPAMFSLKTGSPIIPVFLTRNDNGMFDLVCYEPIYPSKHDSGEKEKEICQQLMRKYLPAIEEQIRANPSQWLVFREFSVK